MGERAFDNIQHSKVLVHFFHFFIYSTRISRGGPVQIIQLIQVGTIW